MHTTARNLLASLLTLLLVLGGVTLTAVPANAAPGDVAAATLQWGIKQSFRTYISGPIAHGGWTLSGNVSDATPFSFTGGSGTASTGTPLAKGETALVIDFDTQRRCYLIEPYASA